MTNQSKNSYHYVELFGFTDENTKPSFDLILRGSQDRYLKSPDFSADVQIETLRLVRADLRIPGLAEPMVVYAVVAPEVLQDSSRVSQAFPSAGNVMHLSKAVQSAITKLDALALDRMFK